MSKKNKISKKPKYQPDGKNIPEQERSGSSGFAGGAAKTASLIVFDRKSKIFVFTLLALYLILSSLKIHTSNIGNWDTFFGAEKSSAVIAGTPKFIRMDEWMVTTPSAISQYYQGLPLKNESIGDLNAPLIWGLPVKDITSVLRPATWSYFIMDVERAFAFSWNFNICFFLISTFLLLMLLTRNKFWLSLTGTFFIFFSGGMQWWSYFIGNYMLYLNGIFISFVYLLYHKKKSLLIFSGIIFVFSIYGFLFNLYPPFQVPLVHLYIMLFIGFIWQYKNLKSIKENLSFRILVFLSALLILGVFLYFYYDVARETFSAMLNTVYPGRRFSKGGNLESGKFFGEFFSLFMSDSHVPARWWNICEASSFIMFFPIVFYGIVYHFIRFRRFDPLVLCTAIFVLIGVIYLLAGFPEFLSKVTLFSMSPSRRALPIIAAGNCLLLFVYLGSKIYAFDKLKFSWIEFGVLATAIFIFMKIVSTGINAATEDFFTANEINITTALIILTYLLIRYNYYPFAKPVLYAVLMIFVLKNLLANPVTKGLSPILENPVFVKCREIYQADPAARWAVFGNNRVSNIVKAAGISPLNGVRLIPLKEDMKILDPGGAYDSAYNRYAWVGLKNSFSQNDTVIFDLTDVDAYTMYMNPCSPRLKQLNVKYFLFNYSPKNEEVMCMSKIAEIKGMFIYKRNDF